MAKMVQSMVQPVAWEWKLWVVAGWEGAALKELVPRLLQTPISLDLFKVIYLRILPM